jgi:alpha-glucosidase
VAKESDREPGLIALALHGIKLVGVRGALQTVRYGRWKDRLDRAYLRDRPSGPEVRPGELSAVATVGAATVLTFGDLQLEVVFVADAIVRLTWTPGGLPAPAAVAPGMAERAPLDGVIAHDVNGAQVFTTDTLRVTVATDGSIEIADRGGRDESVPESERWQVVRRERPPVRSGERWTATVDLGPDDQVHGLGERSALFDLRPGTYGLWNTEQSGTYGPEADPLYITIPVAMVVAPGRGHLSFWENSHKGEVVVGEQLTASFDGGALRTYVTAGGPEVALASFSELTGRPELPPRWALGYHQCRWGYKTEADIRAVVAGFREHDLPVSAIHFDIDYMDRYRVFTVDEAAFPDLAGLTADLAADGIQAVTIIDPGVAKAEDFDLYRDGRDNGRFLKLADGAEVNAIVWPGMVGFPDFSDPAVRGWWAGQYPALLDQGVSGIWHDMCEPAVFSATTDASLPLATRHHLEGQGGDHVEGRNLYGQGMAQAGHEGLRRHRPVRRPWLLTRSGWAGIQRFAWTWTGDVATSWTMLHRTLCTTLNLSLSGVPYTGPDVGGFSGDPSPELYTRWFQMSAWLPFFRSHSIFTMPSREPWRAAGPHLDAIREAMAWRYRLIPYLYTLSWWASTRGDPPIVPVWWSGSGEEGTAADPELLAVDDEFLVGPNVLVAPVFGEDAVEREVRLPAGEWHHLAGDGPQEGLLTVPVTMDRIPVFVRAGAVLPTDESGRDVLHVYPPTAGTEPLASSWYRDDGDGYGPHRLEDLTVTSVDAARWTVTRTIDPGSEFPVDDTDLAVLVHGGPWTVSVDGGEAMTARPDQPVRVGDFSEIAVRRRV